MSRSLFSAVLVAVVWAAPALAQQKPPAQPPQKPSPTLPKPSPQKPKVPRQYKWFMSIGGGVQLATSDLTDQFTFEAHAETGTTSVEYVTKAAPMIDVGVGRKFWKTGGLAVGVSHSSYSGPVRTESDVPHPFFDDSDRHVSGEAGDIGRSETSIHAQLFWVREHRKWRTRVRGGLTFFNVSQDVVTEVDVIETYPYDTAEFRGVTTEAADGSGLGFNVGVDVAWMYTPQFGVGGAVRYTRGSVDLNVSGGRSVSTDAGGVQAVAGIRFAF